MWRSIAVVVLALTACGDNAAEPDASGARTVTGQGVVHYLTTRGEMPVPIDFSAAEVAALVPDGQGGFTKLAGTGTVDGTFTIADVPVGTYYLTTAPDSYLVTDESELVVGYDRRGRPDAVRPTGFTTQPVQVDGLEPWHGGDLFEWYAPDADSYDWYLERHASGAPTTDATSVDMLVHTWSTPLVSAAKGDVGYLTQLGARTSGAITYASLTRALVVNDLEQVSAGTNPPVTGTMTSVAASAPLHVDWRGAAFDALCAAASPDAVDPYELFALMAQPDAYAHGSTGAPDLLLVRPPTGGVDIDLPDLAYANPYPAGWEVFAEATCGATVSFVIPGTAVPYDAWVGSSGYRRLASLEADPVVTPLVGPPIDLRVDATTISWSPPSLGVADRYWITVSAFAEGSTWPDRFTSLITTDTSVTIPPDAFASAAVFFVSVEAISDHGAGGIPAEGVGVASALSALITR